MLLKRVTVNLIGDHNNWVVNSSSFMSLSTIVPIGGKQYLT